MRKSLAYCHICRRTAPGHEPVWCPETQCHVCGQWGHQRSVCPEFKCHACGRQGHIAKHCTEVSSGGGSRRRRAGSDASSSAGKEVSGVSSGVSRARPSGSSRSVQSDSGQVAGGSSSSGG
jgi:hypothetical protein